MGKGQPKRNFISSSLKDKSYGTERRRNFAKEILHNQTEFPKPLGYKDIDASFEEFVNEEVAHINDTVYSVFTLYSNQRFSEYSQSWNHTDKDGNLLLNFITINRENNPKPGTNQGGFWNIPGNRLYTMRVENTLDDNGTESYTVYSMRQPYAVDLSYRINFVTSTYENINGFNNRINELFKSRQCYIRPNEHFIPMVIEEVNDETSYSIDERKFFIQSIGIKVMAYIINKEDFKIERKPKRIQLSVEDDKRRIPKVEVEDYQDENIVNPSVKIKITFEPYHERVEFVMDSDVIINTTEMDNIRNVRVFVNDSLYFIEHGFIVHKNDNLKIRIRKIDINKLSVLSFNGYNPSKTFEKNDIPEKVYDEPTKNEEVIVL